MLSQTIKKIGKTMSSSKDMTLGHLLLVLCSILSACTTDTNRASADYEYPIYLETDPDFNPTDTTEYFVKRGNVYAIDYASLKAEFAFAPDDYVKAIAYSGSDLFYATNSGVFQVDAKLPILESKLFSKLSLFSYEEITGMSLRKLGGCYVLTDYRLLEVTEHGSKSIRNDHQIWAWWGGIIEESSGILLLLGNDGQVRRLAVSDSMSSGTKLKAHLFEGYGDYDGITKSQTSDYYRSISAFGTAFQFLPDSENVKEIGTISIDL